MPCHVGGKLLVTKSGFGGCSSGLASSARAEANEFSLEAVISRRGSLLLQKVGSSVRARLRSWYHAAVARPKPSARRSRLVSGFALTIFNSSGAPIGSLENIVSRSEERTKRFVLASSRANAPLPRNISIQRESADIPSATFLKSAGVIRGP